MNKDDIEKWWLNNPMTYATKHGSSQFDGVDLEMGSINQVEASDSRFLDWNAPLHDGLPFSKIFDYKTYANQKVLEIGCGLGLMSSIWANQGACVSAIDLNSFSVTQTNRRFQRMGLKGRIFQGDAHSLPFQDDEFSYVYSWGVLHHSPNLKQSLGEAHRVLKPGHRVGLMLYNRRSIMYMYEILYREGFLNLESRFLTKLQLASRYGDGGRELGNPYTWPVTKKEITKLMSPDWMEIKIRILGTDLNYIFRHLLPGSFGRVPTSLIKPWARRFGWSLWIEAVKKPSKQDL
jgi:2-polyprenyl-3-methyl-5-hydroxy-6-metoxy-1,4-benzoquinol methylase